MPERIGDLTVKEFEYGGCQCIEERQQKLYLSYANNDYYNPVPTDQQHCWHSSGVTTTSAPPVASYVCCYCGTGATVVERRVTNGHGPHLPYV